MYDAHSSSLVLFAAVLLGLWPLRADSQEGRWSSSFPDLNGAVTSLAVKGDTVYVGGYFTIAGDQDANYVAMWDGRRWSRMGAGMDRSVQTLALDKEGNLYAGGDFFMADNRPAAHVAKWDGQEWSALGSGLNFFVSALAFDSRGALYAGGAFRRSGDVKVDFIARWSGNEWERVGTGMDHNVFAMAATPDGKLYAAGGFATAGGRTAQQVALWDGEDWHSLGRGIRPAMAGHPVYALALDSKGILYAGGKFDDAGDVDAANIAKWDGYSWSKVGGGVNGTVLALAVDDDGSLFAAGYFSQAGGIPARHVAQRKDGRWTSLESGTDALALALALDASGMLYVGGAFRTVGSRPATSLACWQPGTATAADPQPEQPEEEDIDGAFPNPFHSTVTLEFTLSRPGKVALKVYDALGRQQLVAGSGSQRAGPNQVVLDGSSLSSGAYLYVILVDGSPLTRGVIVRE